jgi:hypothetical protein
VIELSHLLAGLPATLRNELFASYQEIMSNYLEQRWEPAALNGGKFCEVVYSIIHGAVKRSWPARASKPANMVRECRSLENDPPDAARVGDRSLRVLIPRVLPVLYEIRNNRGVGHVGGDVNANHMDAEAIRSMASWVMAELVRIFHNVTIEQAQHTIDGLVERKLPAVWDLGDLKRVLDPKMTAKNQALLLLYHSADWVSASDLVKWIEYSNATVFRRTVLIPLHKGRLIEFDNIKVQAKISPSGTTEVEKSLLAGRAK